MWKLKGTLEHLEKSSKGKTVTFLVDDYDFENVIRDEVLSIKIEKYHPPRSLNANGYYWKLCNLLSDELSKNTATSTARIHNLHLRSMWQNLVKKVDGSPVMDVLPDTDAAEQMILEDTQKHLVPVPDHILKPFTNSKGKQFRYYFELRGSSEMDSKEFSRLVDMVVQECKDQGIKTLDDYEMERLEGYERTMPIHR